jgi:hypothetical protein
MAKIIVGAAMLVAGIALMIYCGPLGAAMMALYGAIVSTGFSMVLGGIAQKLQGQHPPAIGIAVKQAASPWTSSTAARGSAASSPTSTRTRGRTSRLIWSWPIPAMPGSISSVTLRYPGFNSLILLKIRSTTCSSTSVWPGKRKRIRVLVPRGTILKAGKKQRAVT